ncbi:MAG: 16S rRNA processing protein RimM [Spirochaetales bacterium]|nr:16S rRNA processing protein RimM [Spirochaetales bacterium]
MAKITIGKVRTSVGVRGYFKVLSFSGEEQHFRKMIGRDLEFRLKEQSRFYSVEDIKMSGTNLTMKVTGIDSPEDARKLSGSEIITERVNASTLKNGEFYNVDLCGCKMVTLDGRTVGTVKSVCENAVADILEVETDDGIRLIPFKDMYIGNVDIKAGIIELIEEWLLQ